MSALSLFASFPWSAIFSTGVVGIAVGAWLNHVLAARREAAKDARERERDRERDERDRQRDLDREDRERQREQKREKEARDRERGIVDAELLESLRSHCGELRPWLIQMNPQTPGWYAANQDLLSRADNDRVRSALGEQYLDLMSAIRYETKSVWIQRKCKMRLSPRYLTQTKSVYHTPIWKKSIFVQIRSKMWQTSWRTMRR